MILAGTHERTHNKTAAAIMFPTPPSPRDAGFLSLPLCILPPSPRTLLFFHFNSSGPPPPLDLASIKDLSLGCKVRLSCNLLPHRRVIECTGGDRRFWFLARNGVGIILHDDRSVWDAERPKNWVFLVESFDLSDLRAFQDQSVKHGWKWDLSFFLFFFLSNSLKNSDQFENYSGIFTLQESLFLWWYHKFTILTSRTFRGWYSSLSV